MQETFDDVLKLGKNVASNGNKTTSAQTNEKILIADSGLGDAGDVIWKCLEQWSQSDTAMDAGVTRCFPAKCSYSRQPGLCSSLWTQMYTNVA